MNITSYNITDVGYHYIGLRVVATMPDTNRDEQLTAVSRNVLKYARDKALRLMLPEPRGSFESVGEKVCQELQHFKFTAVSSSKGYQLTEAGQYTLTLLNDKRFPELRRGMAQVHLATYDNLRSVVQRHIELEAIWSPIVEAAGVNDVRYVERLLRPMFQDRASSVATAVLDDMQSPSPKKLEDALRERILGSVFPSSAPSLPLFRSLCDRLVSLRLLNIMKVSSDGGEFAKSYSPCVTPEAASPWHRRLDVYLGNGSTYSIALSEPDMSTPEMLERLLGALDIAFAKLKAQAGYFDLPDVRDLVCESLRIPEAAFDEGVNHLLDRNPSPLTAGLTYERISGRRKPLVRTRESSQMFNLLRRT